MKKKQSNLRNPKSAQKKAQTDLPLPQPMELACLAAILRPGSKPGESLKTAMEFYVEALLFSRELPSSFEEVVTKFGNEKRWMELVALPPLKAAIAKQWEDTLDWDGAHRFLAEHGLYWKTRSVLDNVRRYIQSLPTDTLAGKPPSADSIIARCQRVNGIPKFLLEGLVRWVKWRRSESKRKAWKTRQQKSSV